MNNNCIKNMLNKNEINMILGAVNTEKRFRNSKFNLFLNDTIDNSGWRDEIVKANLSLNNQLILDFNNINDISLLNNKVDNIVFDWSVVKFFDPIRHYQSINQQHEKQFNMLYNLLKSGGKFLIPLPTMSSYYHVMDLYNIIKKNSNIDINLWKKDQFSKTISRLCKDKYCSINYKMDKYAEDIINDATLGKINNYCEIIKK